MRMGERKSRASGSDSRRVSRCRICRDRNLTRVIDLKRTPLANSFLSKPNDPEKWFPLEVLYCNSCGLLQLSEVVNPNLMFKEYPYRSSSSNSMLQHFRELAQSLSSEFITSSKQLVVEVGSNDGTLLSALKERGVRVLGVDPAANLARLANARGVETLPTFFDSDTADRIRDERGKAQVIVANNVLAHVDDVHEFMRGVSSLLEADGILSVEVPYAGNLNQNVEYDTVYHEHLSYFSVHPLLRLFSDFDIRLERVARLDVHGGSIRVTGRKTNKKFVSNPFVEFEKRCGLNRLETYQRLSDRIEYQMQDLRETLESLKSEGHEIVGYGAPAKSTTLLNACKIGAETLDYVIDTTPEKIGKFTPGTHIPIFRTERFQKEQPPYCLMLAWNYEKEILLKERQYTGQFIVPIPYARVLSRNSSS